MNEVGDILDFLLTQDKVWGIEFFQRKDDEQIDASIVIPTSEIITEEMILEWRSTIGGRTLRSEFGNRIRYIGKDHNGLTLMLSSERADPILTPLYEMAKDRGHGLTPKIAAALKVREKVRKGISYPPYDPRSKVKTR